MPQTRSRYEFQQEASLSQQLAHKMKEYAQYAGSDPKTSLAIARLNVLIDLKIIDPEDKGIELVMRLLQEKRKALFATSEKVNEITKMGLQMPKAREEFGKDEAEEE